jgi:hypothetical protein
VDALVLQADPRRRADAGPVEMRSGRLLERSVGVLGSAAGHERVRPGQDVRRDPEGRLVSEERSHPHQMRDEREPDRFRLHERLKRTLERLAG